MRPRRLGFTPTTPLTSVSLLAFALAVALPVRAAQNEPHSPPPDTAEAHVGKGYEAVKDERYQEAAKEFQAALALDPGLIRARYQLAVCWFALGKMQEARDEFERLEKETGGDASITYYLARLALRAGDAEAAIRKLLPLMKAPPFSDTAYYLGTAYLEKGAFEQAEKWLRVAAQADPRDYRVPDHLARAYQREGRKVEAEKQFEISARLRQSYDMASMEAVACSQLLETKSLDQARPACQQLFDSNDPDKLTTLGLLYGQHGLYVDAVQPLEIASRLDPDSSEIQHDLGLTYFRLRRYSDARTALAKAVRLRPDFFGSNALLGATLYALGQDEPAYKVLSHAHALNLGHRDTANLLFKEAVILANREENQKKYKSALSYLQKAAQLQPEDQEVRQRLSDLLRRLGRAPALKPADMVPPR
jgi:tetratricopeptide (TPR) repeat protein